MALLLEKLYRSRIGRLMSIGANLLAKFQTPFMVYGFYDNKSRKFRKFTRISSTVTIINRKSLIIEDHVWVWHYSVLDATEGLVIHEGCQIGAWVGIFTHGSENSIRLLGKQFINIPNYQRIGYTRGKVEIGRYTFIGAGSIILPGINIGQGCIIGANTVITKDIPDFSIVLGAPGEIKGNTLDLDKRFLKEFDFLNTYYNPDVLDKLK